MTGRSPWEGTAILLMGYGSPASPEELPGYLADILHRAPSEATVREYVRRYALIGGSPQARILESLRAKLEARLSRDGPGPRVYLGNKHWRPNVAEVVPRAVEDGVRRLVAIPLSPYASTWILEPYRTALDAGAAAARPTPVVEFRPGWHLEPPLVEYWAMAIRREAARIKDAASAVLLSAHSLPTRFRDRGDPYPELLDATARAIAARARLERWSFTYQSAGNTTEPWLGPDITEVMLRWKERGASEQLVASFGFVFDHLEVLYDLDIVVKGFAQEHGVGYHRVPMPNDAPEIVEALALVARRSPAGPIPSASVRTERP
jgi:ferrochelatase